MQSNRIKYITKIGILSALAFVVMLFELPLWFAPGFYKLDFSEIIALLGGFSLGPLAAFLIELLKNILHIIIKGTSTACVGELANLVTGVLFTVPAAIIYKKHHHLKAALLGMCLGTFLLAFGGALLNYYVMIPFYVRAYHIELDSIISMSQAVNAKVTDLVSLIVWAVIPFNLFKGVVSTAGCLLLYKRLSPLLHK